MKVTSGLLDFLTDYAWPGNVREMQNLVERMVILAGDDQLSLEDLPPSLFDQKQATTYQRDQQDQPAAQSRSSRSQFRGKSLKDMEKDEVEAALRRNGWVQVRAARELGLTERQIGYRIKKYGLDRYASFR